MAKIKVEDFYYKEFVKRIDFLNDNAARINQALEHAKAQSWIGSDFRLYVLDSDTGWPKIFEAAKKQEMEI